MAGGLSKEAVLAAINAQQQGGAPMGGLLGMGVPGTPRDPLAMRARQEYTRYAMEMQQQGMAPLPFEEWQRRNLQPPQQQSPGGLLDFFRR